MTKMKSTYYREFLNTLEAGGSAYVTFNIEPMRNGVSASFTLKDCSSDATIEFYLRGDKDTLNVRSKIAILKQAVDEFETAYIHALDIHEARIKLKKEKAKARRKKNNG